MKSQSKFKHFHSRKCIWKCRLENGGHLVSASMKSNIPNSVYMICALLCFPVVWYCLVLTMSFRIIVTLSGPTHPTPPEKANRQKHQQKQSMLCCYQNQHNINTMHTLWMLCGVYFCEYMLQFGNWQLKFLIYLCDKSEPAQLISIVDVSIHECPLTRILVSRLVSTFAF